MRRPDATEIAYTGAGLRPHRAIGPGVWASRQRSARAGAGGLAGAAWVAAERSQQGALRTHWQGSGQQVGAGDAATAMAKRSPRLETMPAASSQPAQRRTEPFIAKPPRVTRGECRAEPATGKRGSWLPGTLSSDSGQRRQRAPSTDPKSSTQTFGLAVRSIDLDLLDVPLQQEGRVSSLHRSMRIFVGLAVSSSLVLVASPADSCEESADGRSLLPTGRVEVPARASLRVEILEPGRFEPRRVEVESAVPTRIELVNRAAKGHSLVVRTPDGGRNWLRLQAAAAASDVAIFRLHRPGTYRMTCDLDGHGAEALVGEIVVTRTDPSAPPGWNWK